MRRVTRQEISAVELDDCADVPQRPRHRRDCEAGLRPCPWVGCKHHLYLEALAPTGHLVAGLRINFPDLDPSEMGETCSLDVADRGSATLAEIGRAMGFTRELARRIFESAQRRVRRRLLDEMEAEA